MRLSEQIPQTLFRVLLAEDDKHLNEDLKTLLEAHLPGVIVDAAQTIPDAIQFLSHDVDYALAVVDVRLPQYKGGYPEADYQISGRLKHKRIASICITGYRDSLDVEEYLKHRNLEDPPLKVISKGLATGFVNAVLAEARTWLRTLASQRVQKELRRVFEPGQFDGTQCSGTAALMSLQQSVTDYWSWLDDHTLAQVMQHFEIDQKDGRILRLSLFSRDDCA